MPLASFSDLQAALAGEFGRSDLNTSRVETLCLQVEADLNTRPDFRTLDMLATTSVNTSSGVGTITISSDVAYIEHITIEGNPQTLKLATENIMDRFYENNQQGQPLYYYRTSPTEIRLAPIPDGAYTIDITYGEVLPNLNSTTGTTNWMMTKAPLVYLYGCAYFNYLKLKDLQFMPVYRGLYEQQVDGLIGTDNRARFTPNQPLIPTVAIDDGAY